MEEEKVSALVFLFRSSSCEVRRFELNNTLAVQARAGGVTERFTNLLDD